MNTQFFTQLAETLKDRQELRMNIKKIDGDFVIVVTPNFKEEGKTIQMSGTPEEIDENFITEIQKPLSIETAFESNADEVKKELEEEEEDDKEIKKPETKQPSKKAPVKSKPVKSDKKKPETKVDPQHEKELAEALQPEENEASLSPKFEEALKEDVPNEDSVKNTEPEDKETKSKKQEFNNWMAEGKRLHEERKYKESEEAYATALNYFPEDEKAKAAYNNAKKWVKAVENLTKDINL